jgi:hypothetical protein
VNKRKEGETMSIGTILLIVAGSLTIVLAPLFAFVGSCVADLKGRRKDVWLLLCGLLFPMLILLFLLPQRKSQEFISEREGVHVRFLHGYPS